MDKKLIFDTLFGLYHKFPISLEEYFEESIYDRDWDVIVILDACRADSLRTVTPEYTWLPESVPALWSVGSMSVEWMEHTFTDAYADELADTAYVTANPYSHDHVNTSQFAFVDEVWRDGWDREAGTVPAETVTKRAVSVARTREPNRLIVHYMQPHFPSVPDPIGSPISADDFGSQELAVWDEVRSGRVDIDRVRASHLENLRYVLNAVDDLRRNVDARKAIVSADHGECFGEYGFYGHPENKPIPSLRRVPWAEIQMRDMGTIDSAEEYTTEQSSTTQVDERLNALGYK
jgi:hypothetical protein